MTTIIEPPDVGRLSTGEPSGILADGVTGESATVAPPAFARRSIAVGIVAAAALALFYLVVLTTLGGPGHVQDQWVADVPWILVLTVGFGAQASLMVELRRRHRMAPRDTAAAGTAGGASAVGMVACCAHHVADLAPFLGATGIAVALTAYRTQLMAFAVIVTAVGIAVSIRRLRATSATDGQLETRRTP